MSSETISLKKIFEKLKRLKKERDVYKKALEFFAEDFTWSRVWADAEASQIGSRILQNMYGVHAKKAIAKGREIAENK